MPYDLYLVKRFKTKKAVLLFLKENEIDPEAVFIHRKENKEKGTP